VNEFTLTLTGWTLDEMRGKNHNDFVEEVVFVSRLFLFSSKVSVFLFLHLL
jgi:hypothetical protein